VDRPEILDARGGDIKGQATAVDEYALEFAPDGHEPFQIQLVRHLVVVAVVIEPDVVRW
jgi:hypothetical protein